MLTDANIHIHKYHKAKNKKHYEKKSADGKVLKKRTVIAK